jgi:hypothetical protein
MLGSEPVTRVKDVVERNLSAIRIAGFTRFDQPLGFVQGRGVDEHHVLLLGRGSKKPGGMRGFYHCMLGIESDSGLAFLISEVITARCSSSDL